MDLRVEAEALDLPDGAKAALTAHGETAPELHEVAALEPHDGQANVGLTWFSKN